MLNRIKGFFYENSGSVAKAGAYYLVCQFVVKGMIFFANPIFTRIMTKSEFGMVSNFLAWEGILFPILSFNLRSAINKSRYDYEDDNDSFLASIVVCSQVVIGLVLVSTFPLKDYFETFFDLKIIYVRFLLVYMVFYVAFDYQQIQYNIFRKYKLYVLYSIAVVVISLILSVLLVLCLDDKALGRIWGLLIPIVIICSAIEWNIFRRSHKVLFKYIKYAFFISLPLLPSALSANVLSTSDRIIIAKYCSMDDVAMYSVSCTIAGGASVLWTALNQACGPWLMDNLKNKAFTNIKEKTRIINVIYVLIIIGIMLLAPEIIFIMGGDEYKDSLSAMPPVVLAMICQYFYAFYFNIEYFYGETYTISIGTLLASVVNLLLNLIFIPRYGYVAAAYTTFIGYAVMLYYHYLIVRYKLKKDYIYDNQSFLLTIIFAIVTQCLISVIYYESFIRNTIIILYLIIIVGLIYKYRKIVIIYGGKILK